MYHYELPEENIYFLGERQGTQEEMPPRYRSRYRSFVRQEVKDRLQPHQTFGYVVEPLHPPSDFLRKRSKSAHPTSSSNHRPLEHHNHFEVRLKAPLEDWGGKIVHNNVNHLKKNIRRAQTATHRGDFSELETSGLIPKYALLPKFGKVPKYIIERKKEEELRKKEQEERMRKSSPGPKIIPEAERLKILQGLRTNWNELQQKYKKMSLISDDTIPKKARKTRMENELKDLEKDMLFLEQNRFIAVRE